MLDRNSTHLILFNAWFMHGEEIDGVLVSRWESE